MSEDPDDEIFNSMEFEEGLDDNNDDSSSISITMDHILNPLAFYNKGRKAGKKTSKKRSKREVKKK